jgi:hypothetical protein
MQPDTNHAPSHAGGGYEKDDSARGFLWGLILGTMALTVVGAVVPWIYVKARDRERAAAPVDISPLASTLPQQPPEPRLQPSPATDYRRYREAEDTLLNSYALIDEKGEVARMPIERAMDLIAQRGLPVRDRSQDVEKSRGQEAKKP